MLRQTLNDLEDWHAGEKHNAFADFGTRRTPVIRALLDVVTPEERQFVIDVFEAERLRRTFPCKSEQKMKRGGLALFNKYVWSTKLSKRNTQTLYDRRDRAHQKLLAGGK